MMFHLLIVSAIGTAAASAQSLVGVNARLDQNLNSKTATVGQVVTARLEESVKTPEGIDLPRGTELVGKVDEVRASQNDGPASLSLVFNTAKLKDAKRIPVKATLLAAAPPSNGLEVVDSDEILGVPPEHVGGDESVEQEPGALRKISMKSAVRNDDSGTFTKDHGNFSLNTGSFLQVGIAPVAGSSQMSAAE
jgi:hypothetical protein